MWLNVSNGPYIQIKIVNNIEVPRLGEEFDEHDMKKCSLNANAINCLYCVLSNDEFNRVCMCSSSYEIWKTLEVTHEGTNQVKETKISMLVHNYELFKIDENEPIRDMFTRFTNILYTLKNLGKVYCNPKKILRSLPKSWEAKVRKCNFSTFR